MSIWEMEEEPDENQDDISARPPLKCKRCGSEDVRWRHQGGRWVMFSLTPGVLHKCQTPSAQEDFK